MDHFAKQYMQQSKADDFSAEQDAARGRGQGPTFSMTTRNSKAFDPDSDRTGEEVFFAEPQPGNCNARKHTDDNPSYPYSEDF